MAQIVSFRDLDAWKAAMDLVVSAYEVAYRLPANERVELSAQIRRAAVSVPSNIAEGQASGPGARYRHHVRIAIGSLAELETQLEIAMRLNLVSGDAHRAISDQVARTGKLLHGLARSLWRRMAIGSLAFCALSLGSAAFPLS
jgi:four helix bundle protein